MNIKVKLLLLAYVLLLLQCRTRTSKKTHQDTIVPTIAAPIIKTKELTKFDSIIQQLKTNREITKEAILALNVIDTAYANASHETSLCDTAVQINDSIFYSIINLADEYRVCSYSFIVTIDEKHKKAIAAKYLEPDCDVDYGWDSYELYDHTLISKAKIKLTRTSIFQKKKRTAANEEDNVDHEVKENSYFNISPTGKIYVTKK